MGTTLKVIDHNKMPMVTITPICMAKVQEYVKQSSKEVGWMGIVKQFEYTDGSIGLQLTDCYAPAQEVSGVTTDIDADAVGKYALTVDDPEEIKWWGHSHVNMGCSPSSTDMTTLDEHVEHSEDYFVMTIHNKIGELYCNVYLGNGIIASDMPVQVDYEEMGLAEAVAAELKLNVREKKYVAPKPTPANGYNSYQPINPATSPHTGGGGDRFIHSTTDLKNGNAQSNLMGHGRY